VTRQPVGSDAREQGGRGFKSFEHLGVAHDREALADDLVHQPSVGETRLREDRADRRRRVGAAARPELRLREVEHLRPGGEARVARRGGGRIGLLQHGAERHREFDEGADMRQAFALVGVEQRFGRALAQHGGELPGEVAGVAHPRAHALARRPRRQRSAITEWKV